MSTKDLTVEHLRLAVEEAQRRGIKPPYLVDVLWDEETFVSEEVAGEAYELGVAGFRGRKIVPPYSMWRCDAKNN